MFDQSFPVVGEDLPISLSFENIIFVMEDIDAASPIVRSRERASHKHRRRQKASAKALKAKQAGAAAKSNRDTADKRGSDERTQSLDSDVAKSSAYEATTATATVTAIAATANIRSTQAACAAPASLGYDNENGQIEDAISLVDSVDAQAMTGASVGVNGHEEAGSARCPARINVNGDLDAGKDGDKVKLFSSKLYPLPISVSRRKTEEDGASESTDSFEKVVHVGKQKDESDGDTQRLRVCENGRRQRGHEGGVDILHNGGKAVTVIGKTAIVISNNAGALPRFSPRVAPAGGKSPNLILDNRDVVVVEDRSSDRGGQTVAQNTMKTPSSHSSTARDAGDAAAASASVKAASTFPMEEQRKEEESDSDSSYCGSSDSEDSDSSTSGDGKGFQSGRGRDNNKSASMVKALANTLVAGSNKADRRERKKYASKTGKLDLAVSVVVNDVTDRHD